MNLHRITNQSDWADIDPSTYNFWQKVGNKTKSIVTPANAITIIGLLIVLYGLSELFNQHYWIAAAALAIGRMLDVLDGFVAEITGTKSQVGELLDATVDKIGTILTILAMFFAQVAPWWILTVLLIPHVIISLIVIGGRLMNVRIHPSRVGKTSMALAWLSVVGLIIVAAINVSLPNIFAILIYLVAILSTALGLYAGATYVLNRTK